ncbi:hypothetical protein HA402_005948 [Bradysia odoriphaga]|nr:hypothetical protein HA402_005948 [Bradysia odoriphaga]
MEPNFVHIVLVGVSFVLQVHQMGTMECGTVNFVRPAILGGNETIKGEWPFIVAVYNRSTYICGGTIISYRHILTAAHCIQKRNSENVLSPHEMVVRLGSYNLTNNNETGAIQRNVSAIYIHDEWDPFGDSFDADIAILVLSKNVTFTDDIQPVCMPANGVTENIEGSVVGYVVRRSTIHAEIPRRIIVRSVNSSHCFREGNVDAAFSSNRTFCGGDGNGSPDVGDSGSGYFFTPGFSWAQYGLVAVVRTNATGHVMPHSYHLYTNVTMFKDWIIETVNRTGGEVGEARKSIIMNCHYGYNTDSAKTVYYCRLYDIGIQGNEFETGSFVGSHLDGKTQQDVEEIYFVNGSMTHLPSGFGLFFENTERLTVGELTPNSVSLGTKVVRRSDLRNLKKMRQLNFFRNDIETLHEDALWDLPNLNFIKFIENKLKVLYNETFSKNKMLLRIYFSSNQLNFLPANLFRNNPMLMEVDFQNNFLKTIDEKIFEANRRLDLVIFNSNQLETLPKRVFRNNILLMNVYFENNSLTSIDENLFETNERLLGAHFSLNRIESLPRKLFRNIFRLRNVNFDFNSITTIDENLFINNEKLMMVSFANNRLERIQRNAFRSAASLNMLFLANNRLKNIDIDFAEFERVSFVDLRLNDCIDAAYPNSPTTDIGFGNLVEFQKLITANCSTGF